MNAPPRSVKPPCPRCGCEMVIDSTFVGRRCTGKLQLRCIVCPRLAASTIDAIRWKSKHK